MDSAFCFHGENFIIYLSHFPINLLIIIVKEVTFKEVKELQWKGFKPTSIAKKLGISRQTATKYNKMDSLPKRNSKLRNEYYQYDAKGRDLDKLSQKIFDSSWNWSKVFLLKFLSYIIMYALVCEDKSSMHFCIFHYDFIL